MKLKKNFTLKQKIQLLVLSTTAIIFAIAIGYIGIKSKNQIRNVTKELADSYAQEYANLTRDKLNRYMDAARYLRQSFENYESIPEPHRRKVLSSMLKQILHENSTFLSAWSILKPSSIDSRDSLYKNQVGSTILGNFRYVYYRENGQIKLSSYIEQDANSVLNGEVYTSVKNSRRETVIDPYYYSYSGNQNNEILQTNMVAPVVHEGEFMGVVGIDVPLETLQEMINEFQPLEGSFAFLMTNSGEMVTFPDKSVIGKSIEQTGLLQDNKNDILRKIRRGETFQFYTDDKSDRTFYVSVASVPIGNTNTPWYVGLALPKKVIMETATRNFTISVLVGILGLIVIGVVIWYLAQNITQPIRKLTHAIQKISTGNVDENLKLNIQSGDEIAEMGEALNQYIDGYTQKMEFAANIGKGNLEADFQQLSENDHLGSSLIHMRESLQKARKEEKTRKEEERKQRWVNEGIAKFADILRQNNEDLHKLGYSIISNLVEYLEANQGGIFILNDEDKNDIHYELIGAYAFNKKKIMERHIRLGEGLVGTAAIENETIYMTRIPQDYINITSGMGGTNPDSLLIVPLKIEEDVLGVLEIASFKEFEQYQIEFVEKIAENIASTISSVRVNLKTSELLEKSQQQAEEMSAQEEEMRQNMEELQATQEESARRENELKGVLEAIDQFLLKAEIQTSGDFINANNLFLETLGYSSGETGELNIHQIIGDKNKNDFREKWNHLISGSSYQMKLELKTKTQQTAELISSIIPIKDTDGTITKILYLGISPEKHKE
mgnify:FL=1